MTMLVAGLMYGLGMLVAGIAVGEALCERRHSSEELTDCRECPVRDMPQSGSSVPRDG